MSRRLIMLAATMSVAGLAASAGDGVALKSTSHPEGPALEPDADINPDSTEVVEIASDLPDRVAIDPASAHYRADYVRIGIKFDGKPITNCAEYCVSEGWIKALVSDGRGNWLKERGKPRTIRKPGKVEPYWKGAMPCQPISFKSETIKARR